MASNSYYETAANTMRAIEEAELRYSALLGANPAPSIQTKIKIEISRCDGEWQMVYQEMLAVGQGHLVITEPSANDIADAKKIADDLDNLAAGAMTFQAIFNSVTNILNIYNKTGAKAPPAANS